MMLPLLSHPPEKNHLSLDLKQTFVTTSCMGVFKVDLDISGAFLLEHRLPKAISIALITGTCLYKLFTFKKAMLSSGPNFKDSSFLSALTSQR